jgi:hypothetical protein
VLYQSQIKEKTYNSEPLFNKNFFKKVNEAIIECIIKDSRPFGDLSKAGMRYFLSIALPGFKPFKRQTVERKIQKRYNNYKKKLIEKLSQISDICLTTAVWKSKQLTYFLALTAHYLDKNFKQRSIIIGFRKFIGRHLSNRIHNFIKKEIANLKIEESIRYITTDNAADIRCATLNIASRISCFCHNLNLILKSILKFKRNK